MPILKYLRIDYSPYQMKKSWTKSNNLAKYRFKNLKSTLLSKEFKVLELLTLITTRLKIDA